MNAVRTTGIYIVILFYVADAVISISMLANGTHYVAVNIVGIAVDVVAIVGLWLMKKWGAAFTTVASGKGIGQSILTLQLTYLNPASISNTMTFLQNAILPCVVIATDIFIIIYLFKGIFAHKFR